ncbi:site-specific integrase [Pseudomonas tohonis]|uniref:site-specific integrase n=1 Tax=Pseudomonas tohonis TaxID=2725477 RepID=UPI001F3FD6CB|nr:site-specific integrase [Pseudomonas tohonis]
MGRDGRGVRAISDSSIEITFMYQGVRCRERVKLKPTATNLKRAEQHKAAIELSIANGTFVYAATFPGSPRALQFTPAKRLETLGAYLPRWLEAKKKHISSSTWDGYRKIITGRLVPQFGELMPAQLTRRMIKDWLDTLAVGNKRLANIQSCLRSALNDAIEDELIEDNPLASWTYRRKEAPSTDDDVDPFDAQEQLAILAALPDQGRNMIRFAFWTGMRTSELIALDWGDVDWIRGEVCVRRAMTQAAKGEAEVTKTVAGNRRIKLLAPALEALNDQKALTYLGDREIFQNPRTGERWAGDGPIRKTMWIYALKKAGVRYRYPYQTRHTYASMMLSAGEHPMWVAEQMGHSDWTMIARVYGRWMPTSDPGAGSKAVSVFSAEKKLDGMTA